MTDLDRVHEYSLPRFSWDYERLPEADHWFLLALAYVDSSVTLFEHMIQKEERDTFHHAKVATALLEHSLELFLKGVFVQLGRPAPAHHNCAQLLGDARKLAPRPLKFSCHVDDLARNQPEAPTNQYSRYPTDKRGKPWPGQTHIDLSVWYQEARLIRADYDRLRSELQGVGGSGGSDV